MINKILANNICAGCGLCQGIFGSQKVSVELDKSGFYRPKGNGELNKEEMALFSKVCPGIVVKNKSNSPLFKDAIWGEIFSCFIGYSNDDLIRSEASSGGAISSILVYLLESKRVSAVIHIGASKNIPILNEVKISTSKRDIIEHANSRYSPSAPLINILNDLKEYDSYAFVGKPCDIAALRQYSNFNKIINDKIKYYISFFCAGVPSINATSDIIDTMDVQLRNVKSVSYRKDGWPGVFKIIEKDNQVHKLSYSFTWLKLLGPRIQFRCKICADGIGHLSDIVCADAWEDFNDKGYPTFKNAPGKSLILSRTIQGNELINDILESGYINKTRIIDNFREIDIIQPGQLLKKISLMSRFFALLLRNRMIPKYNTEFYFKSFLRQKPVDFLKNFWGTLKRI